jgi:hypothetical protein
MATNTVRKGAGRAAATERTNRHAQRTPLPPKAGSLGAEAIAEAKESRAFRTGAARFQQTAGSTVAATDTKSVGKAQAFAELAVASGWEAAINTLDSGVELIARRAGGVEALHQAWVNGVWQYEASTYSFADRTTRPRNASGAAKLLPRTHEDAATEMNKVASNKHFRKREPREVEAMVLPFDPAEASEAEIVGYLRGQTVAWYNRLSRGTETATVGRTSLIWVTEYYGERTVTVCCPVTGFRSFRLTALQRVGRGKVRKTEGGNLVLELEDAS